MKTYRYRGHSRTDPAAYRPDGELSRWLERDPLLILGERLRASCMLSEEGQKALRDEKQHFIDAAADRAAAAPFPTIEQARSYVYAS
jgi:pyruvate dehydrogenase E1 component alpha subunit